MSNSSNSKRLAKNSIYMYMRMLFLMAISFYTSRVILQKLGVDDYGIYSLVASVISMFTSLKTVFSASTQRFLNYEMGKGSLENLKTIFNTSLRVNLIIIVVFVILVEIVGVWFLNTKINVNPNRLFAAKYLFQFAVVSSSIKILTTSFDAEIIAHECMSFYAYISIFEGVLKLLVVYLLGLLPIDNLILYGIFLLSISFLVFLINVIYCRSKFKECRFSKIEDKSYYKEMTKFAGWNFLGANAYILSQNGMNMILNIFGGTIVNAARGIVYQINGALSQFINNIVVVINPYCVKSYAHGDREKTISTIYLSSLLLFIIQFCITCPLLLFAEPIIMIWLGIVPKYCVEFLQLILFYSLIRTLHSGVDILFKASGDIKKYQICEGALLLLPLLFDYLLLRIGCPFETVFLVLIVFDLIDLFCILLIAQKQIQLPFIQYSKRVIFPCALLSLFLGITFSIAINLPLSIKLCLFIVVDVAALFFGLFYGMNKTERMMLLNLIKKQK